MRVDSSGLPEGSWHALARSFRSCGHFSGMVGFDEKIIRDYIGDQDGYENGREQSLFLIMGVLHTLFY